MQHSEFLFKSLLFKDSFINNFTQEIFFIFKSIQGTFSHCPCMLFNSEPFQLDSSWVVHPFCGGRDPLWSKGDIFFFIFKFREKVSYKFNKTEDSSLLQGTVKLTNETRTGRFCCLYSVSVTSFYTRPEDWSVLGSGATFQAIFL